MKTIKEIIIKENIIKKSKFISILERFDDELMIDDRINYYKKIYPDATHYCYAYIINDKIHYYDDGEPSKTAGYSIYNILHKNNLTNILCIVIRYYGGIKLGANGLIRAYSNATKVFENNDLLEIINGIRLIIVFDYDNTKIVDNLIKIATILNRTYDIKIKYELLLSLSDYNSIKDELMQYTSNIMEKENVFITK